MTNIGRPAERRYFVVTREVKSLGAALDTTAALRGTRLGTITCDGGISRVRAGAGFLWSNFRTDSKRLLASSNKAFSLLALALLFASRLITSSRLMLSLASRFASRIKASRFASRLATSLASRLSASFSLRLNSFSRLRSSSASCFRRFSSSCRAASQ